MRQTAMPASNALQPKAAAARLDLSHRKMHRHSLIRISGTARRRVSRLPNNFQWPIVALSWLRPFCLRVLLPIILLLYSGMGSSAASFAQEEARPETKQELLLGVLVDTSAHQKNVIYFEREVVQSIGDALAGIATESFVIRYADEVELLQDWSPADSGLRKASLRIELDAESGKNRRTLLYDALHSALLKLGTGNSASRKALIIISEGNDAGSEIRFSEIKKQAKFNHVQCFVLLVADHNLMGGRVRHFGFDLYDLASATSGKAYDVEDSHKTLDKATKDIVKSVR